jgi:MscS family membrane protein
LSGCVRDLQARLRMVGGARRRVVDLRWLLTLCVFMLAAQVARAEEAPSAQSDGAEARQGFRSPLSALRHFEDGVVMDDLDLSIRALDLSELPPGVRDEIGERLALQLALILERLPRVDVPDKFDGEMLTLGSTVNGEIMLRRHVSPTGEKLWQFSGNTMRSTPAIFRELVAQAPLAESLANMHQGKPIPTFMWRAPEIALWISVPPVLKHRLMGLELYQWLGFPLVALLAWLVALIVRVPVEWGLSRLSRRAGDRHGVAWDGIVRNGTSAVAWTIAFQVAAWMVLTLGLPLEALDLVLVGLQVANVLVYTRLGFAMVDFVAAWIRARDKAGLSMRSLDDLLVASGVRIAKIMLLVAMLVWVVAILGAESSVNRLLAGLGIGGIAFALALQEPLKNFFSSLVLAADRPFGVGDQLTFEGVQGKVEHVGFRTTTLRTKLNTTLVVPNTTLVATKLDTHPGDAFKEFKAVLPVDFTVDLAALDRLRARALELMRGAQGVRESSIEIGVRGIGAGGVEFAVSALLTKGERSSSEVMDELFTALLVAARECGVPLRAS